MPRKKNQTKRSGKSNKNSNKSRKKWMNNSLNVFIANASKYWNSGTISSNLSMVILIVTLCVCYKPSLLLTSTYYLSIINPITLVFPSTLMHTQGPSNSNNIPHQSHPNVNNNGVNQFCRIQSSPAPQFQRQVEAENKGYVEFQGCRIVPTPDQGGIPPKVQLMSNEEKDINEIMAQLQSNAIIGDNILMNSLNNNLNPQQASKTKKKSKKDKKKGKKKKKPRIKKIEVDYADTDRFRELDEMNEFGIDTGDAIKKKNKERTRKKDYKTKKNKAKTRKNHKTESNAQWKPRRIINEEEEKNKGDHDASDAEIDVNLMGMYERGFSTQLNKMHYTSDAVYEQIMEDISNHGMRQGAVYDKYHIDFIPDQSSFKLIPPPSVMDTNRRIYDMPKQTHTINAFHHMDTMDEIESKMNANDNSKQAFKNFYALTRMQQKYLKTRTPMYHTQLDEDTDDVELMNDHDEAYDEEEMDDEYAMNALRNMIAITPTDVLSVVLNDDKLPQWLYESDTILDINCGIGDALVYLLSNFTTIRGICMVGTSAIKYKYAQLNIAEHGLSDRIEIVHRDVYDPYITSLYNQSDVVYINWYNIDEAYVTYLVTKLMNDHSLRASKPGRVLLSYDRLLFDETVFEASYTLRFARGWKLHEEKALRYDVSMYMYSIPFYLSKLSNLYVQNYQVLYGYDPMFDGLDVDLKLDLNGKNQSNSSQIMSEQPQEPFFMIFRDPVSRLGHGVDEHKTDDVEGVITSTMVMKTLADMGTIDNIWDTMSSQLIFASFMNAVQVRNKRDQTSVVGDYVQILMRMWERMNARSGKERRDTDDWTYLRYIMFSQYEGNKETPVPCGAYRYILEEWRVQLNALLNEFVNLFFYAEVKAGVAPKMEWLLEPCYA